VFDLERIKSRTQLLQLEFHTQLRSTNDRAIQQIKSNLLGSPSLILTEQQTAGRGTRDRKWWSSPQSLTCSYVFSTEAAPPTTVPITAALATATELDSVQIKWPNDVLAGGRKIAGILTETVPTENATFVVVGIGINVNNKSIPSNAIQSINPSSKQHSLPSTSLRIQSGQQIDKTELLIELVNQLQFHFEELLHSNTVTSKNRDFTRALESINRRLAFRGDPIRITHPNACETIGVCHGVSPGGELAIKTVNGTQEIRSGSVQAI